MLTMQFCCSPLPEVQLGKHNVLEQKKIRNYKNQKIILVGLVVFLSLLHRQAWGKNSFLARFKTFLLDAKQEKPPKYSLLSSLLLLQSK